MNVCCAYQNTFFHYIICDNNNNVDRNEHYGIFAGMIVWLQYKAMCRILRHDRASGQLTDGSQMRNQKTGICFIHTHTHRPDRSRLFGWVDKRLRGRPRLTTTEWMAEDGVLVCHLRKCLRRCALLPPSGGKHTQTHTNETKWRCIWDERRFCVVFIVAGE